jgi:hypothetical protein
MRACKRLCLGRGDDRPGRPRWSGERRSRGGRAKVRCAHREQTPWASIDCETATETRAAVSFKIHRHHGPSDIRSIAVRSATHEAASISWTSSNISHPVFSNHSTAASTDHLSVLTLSHRISPGMYSRPEAPSSAKRSASCSRFLPLPIPSSDEATFSGSAIWRPSLVATLRRRFSRSFSFSSLEWGEGDSRSGSSVVQSADPSLSRKSPRTSHLTSSRGRRPRLGEKLTPACTFRASCEPCAPSGATSPSWQTRGRGP